MKDIDGISMQSLKRLPMYLSYLEEQKNLGVRYISTPKMGLALGISDILIKKDLAPIISSQGKPKIGHDIYSLIKDLKDFLGYNDTTKAVLVGCGNLGRALLSYNGFLEKNLQIIAAFDNNKYVIGKEINNIKIVDVEKLEELCERLKVHIGIITVNSNNAQEVCDKLIASGIKAIWNFAPIHLSVPEDVIVQNENLGSSLLILSKKLSVLLKEEL